MATARNKKRKKLYNKLSKQVDVATAGSLSKSRAGLLLWFFSVVKGYDEADALEFVCDGDFDGGIDGLLLETRETVEGVRYIVTAVQSKYPVQPSKIGEQDVSNFISRAARLQHIEDLRQFIQSPRREELRRLVEHFELEDKITKGTVTFRLTFVTAGHLDSEAQKVVDANNRTRPDYIKVWDIDALEPAIEAYDSPAPAKATVTIPVPQEHSLVVDAGDYSAAIVAVRAVDIVRWPGIADRTLFNFNVRRQLPANKVRSELERATTRREQHDRFLAAHNGITVICREFEVSDESVIVRDPSVVNGAQSIIAFFDNKSSLTEELRVFVKICQLDMASPFARDIAIHSNTQSAVNSRNLRALDGPQLRLLQEFEARFPDITYETRPDASLKQTDLVIQNHLAAKSLCAVMNRRPWFAVKSLSLFEEPYYADIFNDEIHAEQVLFSVRLKQMVDEDKQKFPEPYRRSWALTSIIATYLVAEALRAIEGDEDLNGFAVACVSNMEKYRKVTQVARDAARKTLVQRHDEKRNKGDMDDFKVDFKNEQVLLERGLKVREAAIFLQD